MRIDGNTLAKYLVMVSQVIAWCTVSMMLLRRGLNQVHAVAQQSPSYEKASGTAVVGDRGNATGDTTTTTTTTAATATVTDHQKPGKPYDGNGTPAVVAGVVMIAIAAIMLIISPVIMLVKIIEKRKMRMFDTELESPPKYEDVVESAPRYSSLFVFNNDGEMMLLSETMHQDKEDVHKQMV